MAPGPAVSRDIVLSSCQGMLSVGLFHFHESRAETQLRPRSYLCLTKTLFWFEVWFLVMVDRPEALFLSEFDSDRNQCPKGLVIKRRGHTVYVQVGGSGGKNASESQFYQANPSLD